MMIYDPELIEKDANNQLTAESRRRLVNARRDVRARINRWENSILLGRLPPVDEVEATTTAILELDEALYDEKRENEVKKFVSKLAAIRRKCGLAVMANPFPNGPEEETKPTKYRSSRTDGIRFVPEHYYLRREEMCPDCPATSARPFFEHYHCLICHFNISTPRDASRLTNRLKRHYMNFATAKTRNGKFYPAHDVTQPPRPGAETEK